MLLKGVLKIQGDPTSRPFGAIENINQVNRKGSLSSGQPRKLGITQIEADLIFKKLTQGST